MSLDSSAFELDLNEDASASNAGEHVRQHLKLLTLVVKHLGDSPKDYSEYERLNADLSHRFPMDLEGFEGVEKWGLKSFGGGKAMRIWWIYGSMTRDCLGLGN